MDVLVAAGSGALVGIAFGMTGVGSIFAVPLLVYALGLPPHQAVCVAMLFVSTLAFVSSVRKVNANEMAVGDGLRMAALGVIGAPLGSWVGRLLTGRWLMILFGAFVIVLALRLLVAGEPESAPRTTERKDGARAIALALAGLASGFLAGLLGAGGVLIVPSLVLLGGLEIHRAIATSLAVVFVISLSAISSHLLAGQTIPPLVAVPFVAGGIAGMLAGAWLGRWLSGRHLQRVFAGAMLGVALFILVRSVIG